jgi:hypothetical protein
VIVAATTIDLIYDLEPFFNPSYQINQDKMPLKLEEPALSIFIPTLGTNLLSTGLIGWKAWYVTPHQPLKILVLLTNTVCIGSIASR